MIAVAVSALLVSSPASLAACKGLPNVKICEALTAPTTAGKLPLGPGKFTPVGWEVTAEDSQIRYDLGAHYTKGTVEFEVKGPLAVKEKRNIFAAWPTEDAAESVQQRDTEKKAAFHHVRLFEDGMMLRTSHRPTRSNFEKGTGPIAWKADGWHHIKTVWNTNGGKSQLFIDGKEVLASSYKETFPGFRYLFLGRDNYRPHTARAVKGLVFRNFKVYGVEGASHPAAAAR